MDEEYLIERYNELKEKVFDKYDYFLHEEILVDIGDDGYCAYFIGDHDVFLYDLDLSSEINGVIDATLNIDKGVHLTNGQREMLIKFVGLKKIIDNKILSNPEYDEDLANEFVFDKKDTSKENSIIKTNPIIRFNPNVKNKKVILQEIYTFLNNEGYIECTSDIFHSHFEPSNDWDTKIVWVGENLISLVGLIDDLFVRNILPSRKKRRLRNKTVLNHFKSEKGDLKEGSVKTEGTNIFDTKKYKKIHDFITSLKVDFD